MSLSSLLRPESVVAGIKANGMKQLLQDLAGIVAPQCGVPERLIYETLLQRERLGSTAVGEGIAIPHGRVAGLEKLTGCFARLARPVDFGAMDGEPVDLVFVLLAPEGAGADHLQALARIARQFRNPAIVKKLRLADDPAALFAILTAEGSPRAA